MPQFTKRAIKDAFMSLLNERPFEKITVKEIIEKCGVSRNTFYYHFQDVYDLMGEILDDEMTRLETYNTETPNWIEAFKQATEFARQNKRAVYHLYKSVNHSYLERYIYNAIYCKMENLVNQRARGIECSQKEKRIMSEFYTFALMGEIFHWLNTDMKTNIEEWVSELDSLINGITTDILKK